MAQQSNDVDKIISERIEEIKQLQEEFDIEDIEVIKDLVKQYYEMLPPKSRDKFKRALSFAASDLGQFGGEKFIVAIFGYDSPRDWNAQDIKSILDSWEKGLVAQQKLIEQGKVMTKKTPEGKVAVSSIPPNGIQETDNGEPVVVVGTPVEGDEKPIPRHYSKTIANGAPNRRYGYPMTPNWSINIYGIAHNGVNYIPFSLTAYSGYDGSWATPGTDDFLPTKAPAGNFYSITAEIDQDRSSETEMRFKRITSINDHKVINEKDTHEGYEEDEELSIREFIYNLIDEGIIYDFKAYKKANKKVKEEMKNGLFLLDLGDLREFHEDISALRDDEGNIVKTKSGWDKTNFGTYAVGIFVCNEVKTTKIGSEQLVLVDSGGKRQNVFLDYFAPKSIIDAPAEIFLSFKTGRKPTRWDSKAKKQVEDRINGDVVINSVLGVSETFSLK